jgi:hypothetical protein
VPDTAPTANSTPIARAQRRASVVYTGSPVREPSHSASTTMNGNAIPKHAMMMWHPSESAICSRA